MELGLCDLPRDIIKVIISFGPYGQWFRLSKELNTLASEVISPLNCRISEKGALCWAVSNNKIVAAISLLKDPRIDPSVKDNFAIRHASEKGYKEIAEMVLQDDRVDPSDSILIASYYGHKEIVAMLLQDDRVDPSAVRNNPIRNASANGHKEIVEMLLQDDRVDPSALFNEAIRNASENGHKEIVAMLLKDNRFDTSDHAIRLACKHNNKEIVELLLQFHAVEHSQKKRKKGD
jgi:hypothetical protein